MKSYRPLIILAVTVLVAAALVIFKPAPSEVVPERPVASIEVIEVQPSSLRMTVRSQGTVLPLTESDLSVEVSGRVVEIAENFRAGASFKKNDVLMRIEAADYEAALADRKASLANAKLALAQEEALAAQAKADWEALGTGEPSELTLRKPQLAQANALVTSAEAAVKRAKRDLARCELRAPYDGLVLTKSVDLGQFVAANPGAPIARVYATDLAEVRLPIALSDAAFLDNPEERVSPVRLFWTGPDKTREWEARFVRYDATIDTQSRFVHAIAELDNPFEKKPGKPALRRGLFVEAEIEGRLLENVYSLPRYTLRGSDTVYVLTGESTLKTREVDLLKSNRDTVIVRGGLEPGEKIATSPIAYFVENMPVEVINAQ